MYGIEKDLFFINIKYPSGRRSCWIPNVKNVIVERVEEITRNDGYNP